MIRDRKHETMPREKLQQLQGERLAALVARLYSSVPLYKERMDEAGLDPKAVKGLEDIQKLPFTYKTDLRDTYPCLLYTSDAADDLTRVDLGGRRIIKKKKQKKKTI